MLNLHIFLGSWFHYSRLCKILLDYIINEFLFHFIVHQLKWSFAFSIYCNYLVLKHGSYCVFVTYLRFCRGLVHEGQTSVSVTYLTEICSCLQAFVITTLLTQLCVRVGILLACRKNVIASFHWEVRSWVDKTSLTLQRSIDVPRKSTVMYFCAKGIEFASLLDFGITR